MFEEIGGGDWLRPVYWKNLRPGLVFAGGLTINGSVPPELEGHPVLDARLVADLHDRYRLAPDRRILVLGGDGGPSPSELSEALRKAEARLPPLNGLRHELRRLKAAQPEPGLPVWESAWVDRGTLVWPLLGPAPSLFSDLARDIGLADILDSEALARFALPVDRPVSLHIAVDLSYSMKASGKDAVTLATVELFRARLPQVLPLAEVTLYAFSEECRVLTGPISDATVRRAGTDFAAFARAVRRRRKPDRPNALLLFTDGLPGRQAEALRELEGLGEDGFFYTQIVFNLAADRKSYVCGDERDSLDGYFKGLQPGGAREFAPEEYREQEEGFRRGFLDLARAARGCQLIINVDEALGVAAIEVFDRWHGGLTN